MKFTLLIAGVIELLAGIILYTNPGLIFIDADDLIIRFYGLSAMIIGLLCIFAYRDFTPNRFFKNFFLTMMFFQGALSMISYQDQGQNLHHKTETIICHVIIFSIFVIAYLKDQKPNK